MSNNDAQSARQKQKMEQQAEALRRNLALRREQGKARRAGVQESVKQDKGEKTPD